MQTLRGTFAQDLVQIAHHHPALAAQDAGVRDALLRVALLLSLGGCLLVLLCCFHPLHVVGVEGGECEFLTTNNHFSLL